ncbi:hypothetical protein JXD38_09780 [candidate division WOR-3 bacterium]|nr:hypothetical protein [candidate division WOR-3 bacterium]
MKMYGRARTPRDQRTLSCLMVVLACIAATAPAGTATVEVNLDTIAARAPASDSSGPAGSAGRLRLLVPIPRLCRVVSERVTFRRSHSDTLDRGAVLFADEAIEAGKAFAAFDVGPEVAGKLDITITYQTLPAAERLERESLLTVTRGGQADGIVLHTAEDGAWYPAEDTSLAAFFGGCPPEGFDFRELARMPLKCDVVIVVCTGGWGRVPLEYSDDIAPTVFAMRDSALSWGLSTLVVPYLRVSRGVPENRLLQMAEMLALHHRGSREFANVIAGLLGRYPEMNVVLVGLSNGATFVGQAMRLLAPEAQSRVSVLEFGPPWWNEYTDTPNTLLFDNEGGDAVAACRIDLEVASLFTGIVRSLWTQLANRPVPFSRAVYNPTHDYGWPVVGSTVVPFLRDRFGLDRQ